MEAWGKIDADLPDLLLNYVKIIDQPICGRRDSALLTHRCDGCMIGSTQCPIVVPKTPLQPSVDRRRRRNALSGCETLGVLLEPLDAEELRTDRAFEGGSR
jgi:hypothetical protein